MDVGVLGSGAIVPESAECRVKSTVDENPMTRCDAVDQLYKVKPILK